MTRPFEGESSRRRKEERGATESSCRGGSASSSSPWPLASPNWVHGIIPWRADSYCRICDVRHFIVNDRDVLTTSIGIFIFKFFYTSQHRYFSRKKRSRDIEYKDIVEPSFFALTKQREHGMDDVYSSHFGHARLFSRGRDNLSFFLCLGYAAATGSIAWSGSGYYRYSWW